MCEAARQLKLVLASRSPRRRELLAAAGYQFEVCPPTETEESGPAAGESPAQLVARLAAEKAADVASRIERGLVLGCDTVVECRGLILGKPSGADDARRMLETLRGREHRVVSGLCLRKQPGGRADVGVDVSTLRMDPLSDAEIDDYLSSGAWLGKAGAFGYQDRLGWVHIVRGSESNVVGLPLELLADMLEDHRPADFPRKPEKQADPR